MAPSMLTRRALLTGLVAAPMVGTVTPRVGPTPAMAQTQWTDLSTAVLTTRPSSVWGGPLHLVRLFEFAADDCGLIVMSTNNPAHALNEQRGYWLTLASKAKSVSILSAVLQRRCDGLEVSAIPESQHDDGLPSVLVRHGVVTQGYMTALGLRIDGTRWDLTTPQVAFATGASTVPNPPALTATDGAKPHLWIAFVSIVKAQAPTAWPTGYDPATQHSVTGSRSTALTWRVADTAVEDPEPFTYATSAAWVAGLIKVAPRAL